MSLFRESRSSANDASPDADENFEVIDYPFTNLPELESHIYPHWAILNAGRKLFCHWDRTFTTLTNHVSEAYGVPTPEAVEFLKNIEAIYKRWTKAVVPHTFIGQEVVPSPTSDRSSAVVPNTFIGQEIVPSPTFNGSSADKPSANSWFVRSTKGVIGFIRGKKDQRCTTGIEGSKS